VAIAIFDRYSQRKIAQIVSHTISEFEEFLKETKPHLFKRLPQGRIVELKGAKTRGRTTYIPGLNDYPHLRNNFFRRLVNIANFRIYVLYFDRPELMEWMPKREERKYGRMLQNLMTDVELVPPNTHLFSVTIDSQNVAKPTQEGSKLYTWRKRRGGQRKQRIRDKARHRRWIQQINAVLKAKYPGRRMARKIWLVPSHLDTCLQAADIIANFCGRYHRFGIRETPRKHLKISRDEKEWFNDYYILSNRIWWIHNRRLQKPKHVANFKSD
jgi:hypothetical protein